MQADIIYADPPWNFEGFMDKGLIPSRNTGEKQAYTTLREDYLSSLPVRELAAKDSLLYLWVTDYSLPYSFEVLKAWGFEFSSVGFYWLKSNKSAAGKPALTEEDFGIGMGYRQRPNMEQCWVCKRGKGVPTVSHSVRKLVVHPRLPQHSQKPEEVARRIMQTHEGNDFDQSSLQHTYLELFGRQLRRGWTVLGNEVSGRDIKVDLEDAKSDIFVYKPEQLAELRKMSAA